MGETPLSISEETFLNLRSRKKRTTISVEKMELQTFAFFFLAFVVLADGAPRNLMDDPVDNREAGRPTTTCALIDGEWQPIVGGWYKVDPESDAVKNATNLALAHYQQSMNSTHPYHVKHIWLAEYAAKAGFEYHVLLTLEEADGSSSDEDEDDDEETKSDTCDFNVWYPPEGSTKITYKCSSEF